MFIVHHCHFYHNCSALKFTLRRVEVLGCGLDDLRFDTRQSQETSVLSRTSKLALRHSWPLIQWVPRDLVTGIKRLGREFNHSHPSRDEVKNEWSYTTTFPHPPFVCTVWRGFAPLSGEKHYIGSQVYRNIAVVTEHPFFAKFYQCAHPLHWPILNFRRYHFFVLTSRQIATDHNYK
jgi:hypothetical protein